MAEQEFIFCLLRICIGGIASFLAIMAWSRTRELAWKCMSVGVLISYIEVLYDLLLELGIAFEYDVLFLGFPIFTFLLKLLPFLFFLLGFLLIAIKMRK